MREELCFVSQHFFPDGRSSSYVYITYVEPSINRHWECIHGLDTAIAQLLAQGWERVGTAPITYMAFEGDKPQKTMENIFFKRRVPGQGPQ